MDLGDEFVTLPPDKVLKACFQCSRFIDRLYLEDHTNCLDRAVESDLEVAEGASVGELLSSLLHGVFSEMISRFESRGRVEIGLRVRCLAVEDNLRDGVLRECVERCQAEKSRCNVRSSERSHGG